MAPSAVSQRKIPTRRISFEESLRDLPRHFAADGDLIGSHVVAALSSVFPDGEDFFVRSVRHFRDQISDPDNEIVVSIASLWEIAIKHGLGKLRFLEDIEEVIADEEFDLLNITYGHLRVLGDLPQHHRDPFDRLLISQSLAERMPIVTNDRAFAAYGVSLVW